MVPGEIFAAPGEIVLNGDREVVSLKVANTGDRPIQVGSHYHFAETNSALAFDRKAALGCRLDIPAGTAVRFEPGQSRAGSLVPYAGARLVYGFKQEVMGQLAVWESEYWAGGGESGMAFQMDRSGYAQMFGPTVGDRVRLADTDLVIEIEQDFTTYGEEVKFGGGKVIRDGMGQSQRTRSEGAVDTVITNALILDHWGIVKADVAIKDGRVAAI